MTILQDIEALPEDCSSKDLEPFFELALETVAKDEVFDALVSLADRQWHTYERVNSKTSVQVEQWLIENWSRGSLEDAKRLTLIVAHLGFINVFAEMKAVFSDLSEPVQCELQSFFDEIGDTVADPYSGVK